MAQMGFAHGTHGFGTQHTVGAVNPFFDGGWVRSLVKAGPAAARVKFGAGVEQPGITANALVGTFRPMRFITARIGALGGGMSGHFISNGFGIFGCQMRTPIGAVLREFHDEQLMEMEDAQSGGKPAQCSNRGCSS